jgi:uncharacterized protein (TIGR00369 family)
MDETLTKNKAQQIEESFQKQGFMSYINASITQLEKGEVHIICPYSPDVSQQNGFFHAGIITSIVDVACGYAALSMMPEGMEVLSVEFKVNLLRPAVGSQITAVAKVIKAGKKLTVCEGNVYDENEKLVAKMMATMIGVEQS